MIQAFHAFALSMGVHRMHKNYALKSAYPRGHEFTTSLNPAPARAQRGIVRDEVWCNMIPETWDLELRVSRIQDLGSRGKSSRAEKFRLLRASLESVGTLNPKPYGYYSIKGSWTFWVHGSRARSQGLRCTVNCRDAALRALEASFILTGGTRQNALSGLETLHHGYVIASYFRQLDLTTGGYTLGVWALCATEENLGTLQDPCTNK